jgi:Tol biopolymer transport system component
MAQSQSKVLQEKLNKLQQRIDEEDLAQLAEDEARQRGELTVAQHSTSQRARDERLAEYRAQLAEAQARLDRAADDAPAATPNTTVPKAATPTRNLAVVIGLLLVAVGSIAAVWWSTQGTTNTTPTASASGTDVPNATSASGGRIAFVMGVIETAELYVMDANSGVVQQLTQNTVLDAEPAWSPDGTQIVFHRQDGADTNLYIINADGSNERALTTDGGASPAWSPNGRQIAYNSDGDLYLINADGTDDTQLTYFDENTYWPTWSPDGRQLAFHRDDDDGTYLYTLDLSTDEATRLALAGQSPPVWSPLAGQITFEGSDSGERAIYQIDVDGQNLRSLTDGFLPSWSADGQQLAFVNDSENGDWNLYVMNADGSALRQITPNGGAEPAWSPLP